MSTIGAAAAEPVLRDIHLPAAPGWWPPAPGWWLLAIAAAVLLGWAFVYLYRMVRRRRYRRAVLRELERAIGGARGDATALATALSEFLRRLARVDAADAAAMTGEAWLAHLDGRSGSDDFTRGVGRALLDAPYRPAPSYDAAALTALVRRCVRRWLDGRSAHA
jgi:hypothetical protein